MLVLSVAIFIAVIMVLRQRFLDSFFNHLVDMLDKRFNVGRLFDASRTGEEVFGYLVQYPQAWLERWVKVYEACVADDTRHGPQASMEILFFRR